MNSLPFLLFTDFQPLITLAQELTIIKRKRSAKKIKIICHFSASSSV
ncbi:hypothetical protein HMPREF2531_02036 [Bacteroides intestinalis]|uniref:Uncharacterized protein n=1 Tax=Bacteroides intestinalis TaxID=329854 RepID=A0A139LJ58_9BACE|nr:hypothetical protein HMPREF2531_02036 [Bacteroides intestinalis]